MGGGEGKGGLGAVTTPSLALPFPYKTKTRKGMHHHLRGIIFKFLFFARRRASKVTVNLQLMQREDL